MANKRMRRSCFSFFQRSCSISIPPFRREADRECSGAPGPTRKRTQPLAGHFYFSIADRNCQSLRKKHRRPLVRAAVFCAKMAPSPLTDRRTLEYDTGEVFRRFPPGRGDRFHAARVRLRLQRRGPHPASGPGGLRAPAEARLLRGLFQAAERSGVPVLLPTADVHEPLRPGQPPGDRPGAGGLSGGGQLCADPGGLPGGPPCHQGAGPEGRPDPGHLPLQLRHHRPAPVGGPGGGGGHRRHRVHAGPHGDLLQRGVGAGPVSLRPVRRRLPGEEGPPGPCPQPPCSRASWQGSWP